MRARNAHTLLVRRPSYSLTELMAVAELVLPYIPSHEFPRRLQKHREPFWQSRLDSAGSLPVQMTPFLLCATASLHCLRRHASVLSRQTGPSGVGITVPCDRAHSVVVRAPYGL